MWTRLKEFILVGLATILYAFIIATAFLIHQRFYGIPKYELVAMVWLSVMYFLYISETS